MSEVYMFSREELRRLIAVSVSTGMQVQAKRMREIQDQIVELQEKIACLESQAEHFHKKVSGMSVIDSDWREVS